MKIFRTDATPGWKMSFILSMLPFILFLGSYVVASYQRHAVNPRDKIMPTPTRMVEGVRDVAVNSTQLWTDTWASAKRFLISLALLFSAVILGVSMGVFPYQEAPLYRFHLFFDKLPALALLPILFVVFGLGETTKISLVLIGVFPSIALDAYLRAKAIPREQIHTAHTQGAGELEICYRTVLPMIWPDILDTIRLNFKSIIALLIAGESVAAMEGLGYRIFVEQRYMNMHVIIPYVCWIAILGLLADSLFRLWIRYYKWRTY